MPVGRLLQESPGGCSSTQHHVSGWIEGLNCSPSRKLQRRHRTHDAMSKTPLLELGMLLTFQPCGFSTKHTKISSSVHSTSAGSSNKGTDRFKIVCSLSTAVTLFHGRRRRSAMTAMPDFFTTTIFRDIFDKHLTTIFNMDNLCQMFVILTCLKPWWHNGCHVVLAGKTVAKWVGFTFK